MAQMDLGKVALTDADIAAIKEEITSGLYSIVIVTEEPETVGEKEIVLVVETT